MCHFEGFPRNLSLVGVSYMKLHHHRIFQLAIPFVVSVSNHERIFSQLRGDTEGKGLRLSFHIVQGKGVLAELKAAPR